MSERLTLKDLAVEHQNAPVGIDCRRPLLLSGLPYELDIGLT